MEKVDFKRKYPELYRPSSKKCSLITVPNMNYLMIDGQGSPKKRSFTESIQALYKVSYALRNSLKKESDENYFDYVIPPLEGLWWSEDGDFDPKNKSAWHWTLMMMLVPYISAIRVHQLIQQISNTEKKLPVKDIKIESYNEDLVVQIMHIGSYEAEEPTLKKVSDFMREYRLKPHMKHHEIYLSDPDRTPSERLKTIIRQPVTRI